MRLSLAVSTALGLVGAGAASAQTVNQQGPGPQTYTNPGTVVGNPQAIALSSSTSGAITLNAGGASSDAAPTVTPITVVYLGTSGAGTIDATLGTLTTTGTGRYYGLNAIAQSGAINVSVNTIDGTGGFTRGIYAQATGGGNVTASAQNVVLRGTEYETNSGNTGDGIDAIADQGFATIMLGNGTTAAQFGSVVSANGRTGAKVTVGNATATSTGGTQGSAGIVQGISSNGDVMIDSGMVAFADTRGTGIDALANAGRVTITSGSVTATTNGNTGTGIGANGFAGVNIQSGSVNAGGIAIRGRSANGIVTVTTTGNTASAGNSAIIVTGQTAGSAALGANITLGANTTTSGVNQSTVAVNVTGPATITNNGIITNTNGPSGIAVTTTNGLTTIDSNIVTQTAAAAPANNAPAAAIYVNSTNGGAVNVTSNAVTTNGPGRDGILVNTTGVVSVTSNAITLQGDAVSAKTGIDVVGGAGNVTVKSGTITTANNGGILVQTTSGNIDITATRTVAGGAGGGNPNVSSITNDAVVALTTTGSAKITADYAQSDGVGGTAVGSIVGGNSDISVNTAVGNGASSNVVLSQATGTGNATLQAGSITFNGTPTAAQPTGQAAGVSSANGSAAATIDSVSAAVGLRATGVFVTGKTAASLTLRTATATGSVATVNSSAGDGTVNISGAVERIPGTGPGTASTASAVTLTAGTSTLNVAAGGSVKSFTAAVASSARTANVINNLGTITGGTDAVQLTGTGTQTANTVVNSGAIVGNGGAGLVINGSPSAALASAVTNNAGATIQGSTTGIIAAIGSLNLTNAGTIRGNGITASAIQIQQPNAVVNNSGTISGANYGIFETTGANVDGVQVYRVANTQVTNSGTIRGDNNTGVLIIGSGTVTNSGTIQGLVGTTADGVQLQTYPVQMGGGGAVAVTPATGAQLGTVTNQAGGTITGARYGVALLGGGTLINAGSVTGGVIGVEINSSGQADKTAAVTNSGVITRGVSLGVASSTITNTGMITNTGGGAINIENAGATTIVNSGTLTGAGTFAATLGGGNDSVELRTGSTVNGVIDFGAGTDVMTLNGTGTTASVAAQTVAASQNLETLNVAIGYWTANTGVSTIGAIGIAAGATLELAGSGGTTPLAASPIAIDGTLALNTATGDTQAVASPLSGAGALRTVGAGTTVLTSAASTFTGATSVGTGTLTLTGNLAGDLTTSGTGTFRLGAGGTAGTFGGNIIDNGAFVYDRSDSYTLAGNLTGNGLFAKNGAGTFTIGGTYGFTGDTVINGGSVHFTGQLAASSELDVQKGTVDLSSVSGGRQTVAEISGSSAGTIALGATILTVNQTSNTEFAGAITGTGGLTKTGTGNLNLSGSSSYTGATTVSGGTLRVNGSVASSPFSVNAGGTLGGNGTVGSLTVNGGTLSPGNSIGRMTVNGNIVLTAASTYAVEANNLGQADRVDATGTATLGGARLAVTAASGVYRPSTNYTILTAAGGVSGTFGSVTSNLAFLTPSLAYSATAVTLTLARNNIAFASAGTNANERGVGAAVQALGAGNAVFEAALTLTDAGVSPAFGSLAGQGNAAVTSGLIEGAQPLRTALLGMPGGRGDGAYLWGAGLANNERFGARGGGVASLSSDMLGAVGGVGYASGNFDIGIGGGYQDDDFRSGNAIGRADVDAKLVAGYAAYGFGPASIKLGASYAWQDVDSRRTATIGTVANQLAGKYDADTLQGFGEIAYGASVAGVDVAPFAGVAYVRTKTDTFTETGGATALAVGGQNRDVVFATAGLRLLRNVAVGDGRVVRPFASAAFRYARGDRGGIDTSRFATGTTPFTVTGAGIVRNAADVGGGVEVDAGRFRMRGAYTGVIGKDFSNHGVKLTASFSF